MTPKIKRAITELRRQELYVMLVRRSKGDEASKVADECERQEVEIERIRGLVAGFVRDKWLLKIIEYKCNSNPIYDPTEIERMNQNCEEEIRNTCTPP